ncbi:serine/threonine-protein phosphatase Pgam5, mitochondrial-like isoform X1 [Tribolium madens]|uniref:serine/threonine-protein phosphatase Pgam5, mitochondrial-like isoform X1 n=1 Tax=Tribolium madens TaxID=41895 RepID=UPI001CF74E7A|nr:serine/threonine-protein phosphatase Pgam5, mitochondrial-like isoform X1 [Tribolium madens]
MRPFSKVNKLFLGVCVASGAVTYYFLNGSNKKVYASWTSNYEPSAHARWDDNWDHRSPKFLLHPKYSKDENNNQIHSEIEVNKAKSVRHLILIRHGQYNVNGQFDEDRTLTKLGKIQAEYTGKRLKELGLPYTKIIKSTMSRAQETGSIISTSLPDVPVKHCDLLREGAPIPPEPPIGSWKQEMYKFFVDGARIEAAFRRYFHRAAPQQKEDSYTVLVCHANVIRYFVCRALQLPAEAWLRMSLNHASITWITITPSGRVVLRCLGDSGHMPPDVITSR